jgi:sirohydrochlorin ferrochelatase
MASPMLLVVHGRAGGVIPAELQSLARQLASLRRAPVLLQALTAPAPPAGEPARAQDPLVLVPLFLLPGTHVRFDVRGIAAERSRSGPVRRLPFLGAWPAWQRALAAEVADLAARLPTQGQEATSGSPLLVHHPLEGPLGQAYLTHLEAVTGARCHATPYSATDHEDPQLPLPGPALPLALAANRLTDALPRSLGVPLLQRQRCRAVVLEQLTALP